jgi:hypothetical protein
LIDSARCEGSNYLTASSRTIEKQALDSIVVKSLFLFLEERIFQIYSFEFFEVSRVGNRDSDSVHYFVELAIGVLVEWEALWEERILAQSLAKVRLIL